MKRIIFLFLFLPTIAAAQWSVTPEVGVLFSSAISDIDLYINRDPLASLMSIPKHKPKTGYVVSYKIADRFTVGLKLSSGLYYTHESYEFGGGIKYGSFSIPALVGYEYYFNRVLLSANAGAAYNYGLTLFIDGYNASPEMKGRRNAVNLIADIGVGYKISERCVLKLLVDYSQRMSYFYALGTDPYNGLILYVGKPYHIGVRAGIELFL
ncbi:MAG: hypothetical protein LBF90_04390 [Prevotellaceae bacterium]|jgi:hypothetical protein|nr:hypothetical protein [Prevotellaceae bacterium]